MINTASCSDALLGSILSVLKNILSIIQVIGPILAIISISLYFVVL